MNIPKTGPGRSIIFANIALVVSSVVTFVVSIGSAGWAWAPAAVGMAAGLVLVRAHVRLARMFSGPGR